MLAFVIHWRGKGLWIGLITGSLLQSCMLMSIIFFTNLEEAGLLLEKLHLPTAFYNLFFLFESVLVLIVKYAEADELNVLGTTEDI